MKMNKSKMWILIIMLYQILLIAMSHTAIAEELTGDKKLSCEALICLTSSAENMPDECTGSVSRYFSINEDTQKDTEKARREFLALCPVD